MTVSINSINCIFSIDLEEKIKSYFKKNLKNDWHLLSIEDRIIELSLSYNWQCPRKKKKVLDIFAME